MQILHPETPKKCHETQSFQLFFPGNILHFSYAFVHIMFLRYVNTSVTVSMRNLLFDILVSRDHFLSQAGQ